MQNLYLSCKKITRKLPRLFLVLEILIYSFEKSIMTQNIKRKFMKKNALKLKKASLSRNELRTLQGGTRPDDPETEAQCGCVQASCSSSGNRDGSARCGGGCC